jgi:hypothetical protein
MNTGWKTRQEDRNAWRCDLSLARMNVSAATQARASDGDATIPSDSCADRSAHPAHDPGLLPDSRGIPMATRGRACGRLRASARRSRLPCSSHPHHSPDCGTLHGISPNPLRTSLQASRSGQSRRVGPSRLGLRTMRAGQRRQRQPGCSKGSSIRSQPSAVPGSSHFTRSAFKSTQFCSFANSATHSCSRAGRGLTHSTRPHAHRVRRGSSRSSNRSVTNP